MARSGRFMPPAANTDRMTKTSFFRGLAERVVLGGPLRISRSWTALLFSWPGLGDEPSHPKFTGVDASWRWSSLRWRAGEQSRASRWAVLIASRQGRAGGARQGEATLLTATFLGTPGRCRSCGANWQSDYNRAYSARAARWIGAVREDLSEELTSITAPDAPALGRRDPISP